MAWARSVAPWCALLAVTLHVFAVEGHVHIPQIGAAALYAGAAGHERQAEQSLSNSPVQSPCVFCQTMAASGPGLTPSAPLLLAFAAAPLAAVLFGRRLVALQRLVIWRSRAPTHRL
jgi:hypothetical protein